MAARRSRSKECQSRSKKGPCVPWSAETEVELTKRIDIGLMPLADTEWARGKCAFKAIQYLAMGFPRW